MGLSIGLGRRVAGAAMAALFAASARAETFTLNAGPGAVAWGNYDAAARPALRIRSGDTVVFHTLITNSPAGLEGAGVAPGDVQASLRAVFDQVKDRGPGGHILDGPVFVEGAEPGDVLEIRILRIDLDIPYAYNAFRYGAGFLSDDFPYSRMKIIPLDKDRMVARFAPGVEAPLHPFFGSMGVAPPPAFGRYDSAPPTVIGGNMDDKALTAGTTLYLPVWAPGALFEIGDGHAGQGNGEVDITALETSLAGTLQFVLHKGQPLGPDGGLGEHGPYPHAETPTDYIAMGFDDDLARATRKALLHMIDFLVAEKHMTRDDAYMLISIAGDVEITELVDRNKGVHVRLAKALFTGR
jgi:acetamidase/formamidase